MSLEELTMCVRALDPGSRALLDLSLRRRLPFEAMAGVLHTDPFDLARRRARAVARIAAELDLEGSGVVAMVRAALARLPDDAWCVPAAPPARVPPAAVQEAVQAESMAEAARALMEKLREQRERVRQVSIAAGVDPSEQPTVEMEVVRLESVVAAAGKWSAQSGEAEVEADVGAEAGAEPETVAEQPTVERDAVVLPPEGQPEAWAPIAATPMAAAFSHHPAFAVEVEVEAAELPPLAVALAAAAATERQAADPQAAPEAVGDQPTIETEAMRTPAPATGRPAQPLTVTRTVEREPRRRLARGGLIVGLLLALLRFFVGRR